MHSHYHNHSIIHTPPYVLHAHTLHSMLPVLILLLVRLFVQINTQKEKQEKNHSTTFVCSRYIIATKVYIAKVYNYNYSLYNKEVLIK